MLSHEFFEISNQLRVKTEAKMALVQFKKLTNIFVMTNLYNLKKNFLPSSWTLLWIGWLEKAGCEKVKHFLELRFTFWGEFSKSSNRIFFLLEVDFPYSDDISLSSTNSSVLSKWVLKRFLFWEPLYWLKVNIFWQGFFALLKDP